MNENNKDKTNYTLLKVISFLFPIIGLIIYAINVGKNETLVKESSKWALIGLAVIIVIILLIIILNFIFTPTNTAIYGSRY